MTSYAAIPLLVTPNPSPQRRRSADVTEPLFRLCTVVPNFLTLGRMVQLYLLHPYDCRQARRNSLFSNDTAPVAATPAGIVGELVGANELGDGEVLELVVRNGNPLHPTKHAYILCDCTQDLREQFNLPGALIGSLSPLTPEPPGSMIGNSDLQSPSPSISTNDPFVEAAATANSVHATRPEYREVSQRNSRGPDGHALTRECLDRQTGTGPDPLSYYPETAFGPPDTWRHYIPPTEDEAPSMICGPRDSRFHVNMWSTAPTPADHRQPYSLPEVTYSAQEMRLSLHPVSPTPERGRHSTLNAWPPGGHRPEEGGNL
ncbi:hypothetical protein FKP32DRAFT_1600486 [Trametes sanguinea]|nr:hypothetical protein FKP32DRAFT_1600486 [Trametes sanguinea]